MSLRAGGLLGLRCKKPTPDAWPFRSAVALETRARGLKKEEEEPDFKVVLIGRTDVGKSTIWEALTRGTGVAIGSGDNSTTKHCRKDTWRNLLRVWDTPGFDSLNDINIDANGTGDEEKAAQRMLATADLVLFVFTSRAALGEKEREWFNRIAKGGRPFIVLLNVFAPIEEDYSLFKARDQELEICKEKQKGRIENLFRDLSDEEKRIAGENLVVVHAQAGFYGRARGGRKVEEFFEKNKDYAPREELRRELC